MLCHRSVEPDRVRFTMVSCPVRAAIHPTDIPYRLEAVIAIYFRARGGLEGRRIKRAPGPVTSILSLSPIRRRFRSSGSQHAVLSDPTSRSLEVPGFPAVYPDVARVVTKSPNSSIQPRNIHSTRRPPTTPRVCLTSAIINKYYL
jgi:hypothetical protein